jgi:hypothetical protein
MHDVEVTGVVDGVGMHTYFTDKWFRNYPFFVRDKRVL